MGKQHHKIKKESNQYTQVASYKVRTVTSKLNFCKKGAASIIGIKPMRLSASDAITFHLRCLRLVNVWNFGSSNFSCRWEMREHCVKLYKLFFFFVRIKPYKCKKFKNNLKCLRQERYIYSAPNSVAEKASLTEANCILHRFASTYMYN